MAATYFFHTLQYHVRWRNWCHLNSMLPEACLNLHLPSSIGVLHHPECKELADSWFSKEICDHCHAVTLISHFSIIFIWCGLVQMELSRHSEVEIAKRMDEIAYLKRACNLTHTSIVTQHKTTPNPESVYMELASLKEQVLLFFHSSCLSSTPQLSLPHCLKSNQGSFICRSNI
jgi:hypothetical protein